MGCVGWASQDRKASTDSEGASGAGILRTKAKGQVIVELLRCQSNSSAGLIGVERTVQRRLIESRKEITELYSRGTVCIVPSAKRVT